METPPTTRTRKTASHPTINYNYPLLASINITYRPLSPMTNTPYWPFLAILNLRLLISNISYQPLSSSIGHYQDPLSNIHHIIEHAIHQTKPTNMTLTIHII